MFGDGGHTGVDGDEAALGQVAACRLETGSKMLGTNDREADHMRDAGPLGIRPRNRDGTGIAIARNERRSMLTGRIRASPCLVCDLIPERIIMLRPTRKTPTRAQDPRRDIGSDEGGLDGERARAAHRIGKGRTLPREPIPAGSQQHIRCQRLFERGLRLDGLLAIPPAVQRRAGEVEVDGRVMLVDRDIDGKVGVVRIDVRTLAAHLAQAVAYGILHLERCELGVAQERILAMRLHRDGGAGRDVVLPRHPRGPGIEGVGITRVKTGEHQLHAGGYAAPKADAICIGNRAEERGTALEQADASHGKAFELSGKRAFEACCTTCEELEIDVGILRHRWRALKRCSSSCPC